LNLKYSLHNRLPNYLLQCFAAKIFLL